MDFLAKTQDGYLDLYYDSQRVTDEEELSEDSRTGYLYATYADSFVRNHAASGTGQPVFLYWAFQDPHTPLSSPDYFLESEPCVYIEGQFPRPLPFAGA